MRAGPQDVFCALAFNWKLSWLRGLPCSCQSYIRWRIEQDPQSCVLEANTDVSGMLDQSDRFAAELLLRDVSPGDGEVTIPWGASAHGWKMIRALNFPGD